MVASRFSDIYTGMRPLFSACRALVNVIQSLKRSAARTQREARLLDPRKAAIARG
jgi:hypothetical protein